MYYVTQCSSLIFNRTTKMLLSKWLTKSFQNLPVKLTRFSVSNFIIKIKDVNIDNLKLKKKYVIRDRNLCKLINF